MGRHTVPPAGRDGAAEAGGREAGLKVGGGGGVEDGGRDEAGLQGAGVGEAEGPGPPPGRGGQGQPRGWRAGVGGTMPFLIFVFISKKKKRSQKFNLKILKI